MIDIKIEGDEKTRSYLKRFPSEGMRVVTDELWQISKDMRTDVIKSMRNTAKNYAMSYQRGRKVHHPSLPGYPPAIDTGELIGAIHLDRGRKWAQVYIHGAPYAEDLEEGKHVKARPFWEPAIGRTNWRRKIENRIDREI